MLFDGADRRELMTEMQSLINDGLAVNVGDNAGGQDALLKLADPAEPAAMTIATSAAIGTVITVLDGGLIPGITSAQLGVGPMPGPGDVASAIVGGASLYIVTDKGDAEAAGGVGLHQVPDVGADAVDVGGGDRATCRSARTPSTSTRSSRTYVTDPRFKVAYDQLLAGADDLASVGPVLGPLPQVRTVTAGAVAAIFGGADVQSTLDRRRPAGRRPDRPVQPAQQLTPRVVARRDNPIWAGSVPGSCSGRGSSRMPGRIPPGSRVPFLAWRDTHAGVDLCAIEDLASGQHGLVTRDGARRRGVSRSSWYRAVDGGVLQAVHPGVARLVGAVVTREQQIAAAVLGVGSGAMASPVGGPPVGLPRPDDDPVDVILPIAVGRPRSTGCVVHRPRDRKDLSPVLRLGIRTSNVLRMLCDLGAVDATAVPAAVGHVVTAGLASPVALRTAVDVHARRGRHGVPAFREALDDWVLDGKPADSVLEPAMRRLLAEHRLPPAEFHRVICGYEVDFWVIDSPIVLECDGWDSHGRNRAQFERDRVRDADLAAAGYVTIRFTYRQLIAAAGCPGRADPPDRPAVGTAPPGADPVIRAGIVPGSGTIPAQTGWWDGSRPDGGAVCRVAGCGPRPDRSGR